MPEFVRQTQIKIMIAGADATAALAPYLMGFEHEDCAGSDLDRNSDSITIHLDNKDLRFLREWYISKGTQIQASIIQLGAGTSSEQLTLDCGTFYVDKIDFIGTPNVCTIKANSIPIAGTFKGFNKDRAWENSSLKDIASQLAGESGMSLNYRASVNPTLKRVDQDEESDAAVIRRLCDNHGLSMKIQGSGNTTSVIILDEAELDTQPPTFTITLGVTPLIHYELDTNCLDTAAGMHSSYFNPETGQVTTDDWTAPDKPEGVDGIENEHDRPDYDAETDEDVE